MPAGSTQPTNVLRAWLLLLLRSRSAHGYELSRRMAEHGTPADRSAIYRALHDLEGSGYVVSDWKASDGAGPHRRVYKLTRSGRRELERTAQRIADAKTGLDRYLSAYDARR